MDLKQKSLHLLTDEEILTEFVNRFRCDGAVLIYFDSTTEYGFGRWRNSIGRKWVNSLFKSAKDNFAFKTENKKIIVENNSISFKPIFIN